MNSYNLNMICFTILSVVFLIFLAGAQTKYNEKIMFETCIEASGSWQNGSCTGVTGTHK